MKWLFFRRPLPTIASVAERDLLEGEGSAFPRSSIRMPWWIYAVLAAALLVGSGAVWWKFLRPEKPLTTATRLLESGQLQAARALLRDIVATEPGNLDAHFRLGSLHLRLNDAVAASKELRIARDMGMPPRQVSPLLAQAYLGQQMYKELLEEFPTSGLAPTEAASLLTLRAMAQLALNDNAAAASSVALAEQLDPDKVEPPIAAARVAYARGDRDEAEKAIERALEINPLSGEALSLKGLLATDRGDTAKALEAYDAAMAAEPSLLATRLNRANLEVNLNMDAQAKLDIDFILADQPDNPTALYMRAILLARAKDYRAAHIVLQKIDPYLADFPRGLYILATVKANLGQGAQAMEAATKYVARNPADLDGVKLLSSMYLTAGQIDKTVELLNAAVAQGHVDADLLYSLGQILVRTGQKQAAIQRLEQAAALAPANVDIRELLEKTRLSAIGAESPSQPTVRNSTDVVTEAAVAASLTVGDLAQAKAQLEVLRQADGFSEHAGLLTGMIRLAELDLQSAAAVFKDVVQTYPDSTMARVNLAKIAAMQNHVDEAEKILNEALAVDPRNRLAATTLASILLGNGLSSRAIGVLEAAHDAAPTDLELTTFLLDAYTTNGQAPKAITMLRSLSQEQAASLPILAVKARAQQAAGRSSEARETYLRMLTVNPTDKAVRLQLVAMLLASKDTKAAQQVLRDGVRITPGDSDVLAAIIRTELQTSGVDAALAAASELAGNAANQPAAGNLRGDVYLMAGRLSEAADAYAVQLAAVPSSELTLRYAGALYAAGQKLPAYTALEKWLVEHPNDIPVALSLAGLDLEAGRFAEAEPRLVGVLERQPNNPIALSNLAWVYQTRNDPRAKGLAQRAYFLAPGPASAASLGWVLTTSDDATRGLVLLIEASRQLPNDPALQFHLAYAYNASGKKDKAETVLRSLLSAHPYFADRAAAVSLLDAVAGKR